SQSLGDQVAETFTGRFTDSTMWLLLLGAAAAVGGILLAVVRRQPADWPGRTFMRTVLRLLGWTMLAAITAWLIWWQPWRWLPPQWNPWEPLAIEHPMTFVSKWKLGRLADEPERCLDILQRAP